MNEKLMNYNSILEVQKHLHELQWEHWARYELFTYQWWMLIAVLVIPWIVWWRLVDKTRAGIIFAYGLYIMFAVTSMDAIGSALQFWIYPIKLLPIIPDTVGIDWGLLAVVHMFIYQYFKQWKLFIIAETIFAALLAFIGEPFAGWLGVYFVLHWCHYWSFLIYIMNAIMGKWLIETIFGERYRN